MNSFEIGILVDRVTEEVDMKISGAPSENEYMQVAADIVRIIIEDDIDNLTEEALAEKISILISNVFPSNLTYFDDNDRKEISLDFEEFKEELFFSLSKES